MSAIPALDYPEAEHEPLNRQAKLFADWTSHIAANLGAFEDYSSADFVFDGFFPHYFSQKVRVLFVGRESRGLSAHNYIEVLHRCYRTEKKVGGLPLNRYKFHRLMLYAAFSLNNGFCDWDATP